MGIRPASGLVLTSCASVVVALLAFWLPVVVYLLVPLLGVAGVLGYLDLRELLRARSSARATRELSGSVGRGVPFSLCTVFEAPQAHGAMRILLMDVLPPGFRSDPEAEVCEAVGPKPVRWERTLRAPVRGDHGFGPLCWEIRGPWGFLSMRWRTDPGDRVTVVPEAMIAPELVMKREFGEELLLDQVSKSRLQGEGTEFESLAEFRHGDDPRKLDWRATARSSHLIVRRYQLEQHQNVIIALDLGRMMSGDGGRGTKVDCAVESALMLARVVLRKGDRCGLVLFDSAVRGFLQPRPGAAGLSAISNALAAVQPTGQETSLIPLHEMMRIRHPRRSLLVVLSDLADKETTQRSRAALSALARQHLVLFVGLRSPELHRAVRLVPESGRDIALNALALAMLRQRHEAIHGMVSAGVHVLDVEPAALTVPLVKRYLELRQRNLL